MRHLILLFALIVSSYTMAQNTLDKIWREIEREFDEGKFKSLEPKINQAIDLARKENNTPFVAKGMFARAKIQIVTQDEMDDVNFVFRDFEKEINHTSGVEKVILTEYLRQLYSIYWVENSWKFRNRTNVQNSPSEDIRFWSQVNFIDKNNELYAQIKAQKNLLQKEKSNNWLSLFAYDSTKEQKQLEASLRLLPTLWDVLANNQLQYLQQNNAALANEFIDEWLASDARLTTEQKMFLEELKINHQEDLLGELNYKEALRKLIVKYPKNWYSYEVMYHLVSKLYNNQISEQEQYNEILGYLKQILSESKDKELQKNAKLFLDVINNPSISLVTDEFITPNQVNPIQIAHRNTSRFYIRIYDYNIGAKDIQSQELRNHLLQDYQEGNSYEKFLSKLKIVDSYEVDLKKFTDNLEHSTLFALKPLPKGRYILVASLEDNFKRNSTNKINILELKVTDYSILYDSDQQVFQVVNRQTGKKQANKPIEIYTIKYVNRQPEMVLDSTVITNNKGFVKKKIKNSFYYRLADENIFYLDYNYGKFSPKRDTTVQKKVELFTDRAIYRPGQTVYFKAIAYTVDKKNKTTAVIPKQKLLIKLLDANQKEIQKVELTSNEFGSVNGTFSLPASVLTGLFTINIENLGSKTISVEEYKRPKFLVQLDDLTQTYQLNSAVKISGKAETFSGGSMNNARVKYRVYRQAIFPYWFYNARRPNYEAEEELIFGQIETNNQGEFVFHFPVTPARERNGKNDVRTYTFRVIVEVTDINGETHSTEKRIMIGDKNLMLQASLDDKVSVKDLEKFVVSSTDLNANKIPTQGVLTITELEAPKRALRKNNFTTNYELYTRAEFEKLFPHDAFANEDKPQNWQTGKQVFSTKFNTQLSDSIQVTNVSNWKEGYYTIRMNVLVNGEQEEFYQMIYLSNPKKKGDVIELFQYMLNQESFQPKDKVVINFATNADYLDLKIRLEVDEEIKDEEILSVTKKGKSYSFPVEASYRDKVFVHYEFVKYNSSQQGTIVINIPSENKNLEINTKTVRDLLSPATKEKWTFTIKGSEKDKILSEFLATMYDASLDQFTKHSLRMLPYNFSSSPKRGFAFNKSFNMSRSGQWTKNDLYPIFVYNYYLYPINTFDFSFRSSIHNRMFASVALEGKTTGLPTVTKNAQMKVTDAADAVQYDQTDNEQLIEQAAEENFQEKGQVTATRSNLQETAFFYPTLKTDEEGNIQFEFTVPESLTKWKMMGLAHTKDMKIGYYEKEIVTQKELMVVPNMPRFLRAGDNMKISTKIMNLSDKNLVGKAKLILQDAFTQQPLDVVFENTQSTKDFLANKGQSTEVNWEINIPEHVQLVTYKVTAEANGFTDGEESTLPIVTNRMLVTETLPLYVRENQIKSFEFKNLLHQHSTTLDNYQLTLEWTNNPIWYAIFSLPYLKENPNESSEQTFSSLYANLLSEKLLTSNPKIKAVFDDWNKKGQLKSKLALNQELKSIILEETPWVQNSMSEEEQMKRIAVLFDLNTMQQQIKTSFEKLMQKQKASGGFSWYDGGLESEFFTTYILSGFGSMKKMGVDLAKFNLSVERNISEMIKFIDHQQLNYFNALKAKKLHIPDWNNGVHYLYARSFFLDNYPFPKELDELKANYINNLKNNSHQLSLQAQAMAALVLERIGEKDQAKRILDYLKETSVNSDEMGMYWKKNVSGWAWHATPVETQATLIEAFSEINQDEESVEKMKVWLLKNRQTNQWNSTKATTKAVYALLGTGKSWLDAENNTRISIGNKPVDFSTSSTQSGTGMVKKVWTNKEILPEMGNVEIEKKSPGVAWGALYWQYFEDLDKIQTAETGIAFQKDLYRKENTTNGPMLMNITEHTPIKIGDVVVVRLRISIDRPMQFVHIKDMRAAGFEPVNSLSGYRYNGEFGYYQSTRDLATNFYADYMPRGTYVFEYELIANNEGDFSNGITTMQNMYAPELSAHSKGIRVQIKQ
ncbi:alpha-2-macroglobulin family protein [uncultured Weeksella sp.]|uniref:alpha-2-macroglobulin family protein n=1 Tax=uncultured Weeksella sp. TaxID=1161389 RepID=UPI00259BA73C|nr:alpha-2-macroglobulin family protein [uncultured Weeksella sp.]